MKFNAKQKFYFALGLALIGLILLWVFMILPFIRSLKKTAGEFIETKREFSRLEVARGQVGELEEQHRKNEEILARINDVLFEPEKDDLDFILLIERMAKETNNNYALSAPVYSSEGISPPYFSSALILKGTFENLVQFLERFDTTKFYTDIDGITIRKTGEEFPGEGPLLETQLTFKAYTL